MGQHQTPVSGSLLLRRSTYRQWRADADTHRHSLIETQYKTILVLALFSLQGLFLVWAFHIVIGYVRPNLVISPYFVVNGFTLTFGRDVAWWATLGLILGTLVVAELAVEAVRQRFSSQLTSLLGRPTREWDPRLWKEIERDPLCKVQLENMARSL